MLKDGKLNFYWVQTNNNLQAAPNSANETYPGYRNPENFIVVSDAYPTVTAMAADLILPAAMWVEKEGAYGNAERRTHFWHQLVECARRGAFRPLADRGVLQAVHDRRGVAGRNARGQSRLIAARRCSTCCSATARWTDFRPAEMRCRAMTTTNRKHFGFYLQKGLFEEYAAFGRGHGHDLAPFDTYHQTRGLRWPVVDGKETRWRYREGLDPYVKAGRGRAVLRQARRPRGDPRRAVRAAGGNRRTRNLTSGWSPGACWSTGIPAR